MDPQIWIVVAIGVVLMIGWTLAGWWIVRMGFTRDRDAVGHPHADADAPERAAPVRADAQDDPNAIWRAQMKAATLASGARCDCPGTPDQDGVSGAQVTTGGGDDAGGRSGISDDASGRSGISDGAGGRSGLKDQSDARDPSDAAFEPDPGCPVHRWDFA